MPSDMRAEDVRLLLEPWIQSQQRQAWLPIVEQKEPTTPASKFCGDSWLLDEEIGDDAPLCDECTRPLQLFVQLDLDQLPSELGTRLGSGVLQLFYCVGELEDLPDPDDCGECFGEGAWEPFSDIASLVRVVPAEDLVRQVPHPLAATAFPALAITGWRPITDLPDPDDHAAAGMNASHDFDARTITLRCPAVGLHAALSMDDLEVESIAVAEGGDKLSGWPQWIQGSEYPNCPQCGSPMELVFQVGSEDNVPFMFGDSGVGHISACIEHKTVAFGWACS